MNKWYIYVYLDSRKRGDYIYGEYKFEYEPFYIGRGGGRICRITDHLKEAYVQNKENHKCRKIRKIKQETGTDPIYFKIKENLSFEEANELEIKLISIIGKLNDKCGPLVNITDGGTGSKGFHLSKESKLKRKKTLLFNKKMSKKNHPLWANIDEQKMLQMYNDNILISDIAKFFNINKDTIQRRLKFLNVSKRRLIGIQTQDKNNNWRKIDINSLYSDFKNNVKVSDLCNKYFICNETIKKRLIKMLGKEKFLEISKCRKSFLMQAKGK